MSDDQGVDEHTGGGTAAREAPSSLFRSIAHRLAGERQVLPVEGRLASFDRATGWLNSEPLTPEALRGRVVLVDFWTYTCVNWLRTLPYVRAWAAKYADAGLTIVGVAHARVRIRARPRATSSRSRATSASRYPIAVDSDYGVWDELREPLLAGGLPRRRRGPDPVPPLRRGRVRDDRDGDPAAPARRRGARLDQDLVMVEPQGLEVAADWRTLRSPETYLGYGQSSGLRVGGRRALRPARTSTQRGTRLPLNTGTSPATGRSRGTPRSERSRAGGSRSSSTRATSTSSWDRRSPVRRSRSGSTSTARSPTARHGTDVDADGRGCSRDQHTYQLIRQSGDIADRRFEIEFLEAGAEAYCFTFG